MCDTTFEHFWIGYNGGPRGGRNSCARTTPGMCGCVHAEVNALVKADARVEKLAFLTHAPCERCAVLMVNSRVQHVYYGALYASAGDASPGAGLALLAEHGVGTTGPA